MGLHGRTLFTGKTDMETCQMICQMIDVTRDIERLSYLKTLPNGGKLIKLLQRTAQQAGSGDQPQVQAYGGEMLLKMRAKYGASCYDLARQMLSLEPAKRISAHGALKSNFLSEDPRPCTHQ